MDELYHLENIRIPRCYKANMSTEPSDYELHVFCDASESAFGAVAYVRMTAVQPEDGKIANCSFIMAKTRLAPLKQLSIAQLELQAAVLDCRLAATVKQAMTYRFARSVYWTDSQIVLAYIRHESRRFHTFTANRISEIHDSSDRDEWHHVPGHINPADACSRGASGATLSDLSSWWEGPDFLKEAPDTWPSLGRLPPDLSCTDPEVMNVPQVLSTQVCQAPLPDPARFSSWVKYQRIVAWIKRFINNLKAAVKGIEKNIIFFK